MLKSAMTPSRMGRMAWMEGGQRPSIFLASRPTPPIRTLPVSLWTATTDGSLKAIPWPRTYTTVLAVPRSMPISREKRPTARSKNMTVLDVTIVPQTTLGTVGRGLASAGYVSWSPYGCAARDPFKHGPSGRRYRIERITSLPEPPPPQRAPPGPRGPQAPLHLPRGPQAPLRLPRERHWRPGLSLRAESPTWASPAGRRP